MRDNRGSTLTEVLVVVAIIAILALFAMMRYRDSHGRAYDAKVITTMRNLATNEEAYFATHHAYASDMSELAGVADDGVTIAIEPGNSGTLASSFSVTATHAAAGHTYTWISDPAPGEPNLVAHARDAAGSVGL